MTIKIGKIILGDWKPYLRNGISGWFITSGDSSEYIIIGETGIKVWQIQIGYDLRFLHQVFDQDFLIGTGEEVKQKIDEILFRIDNLSVFI
jgi:hypothetical protein